MALSDLQVTGLAATLAGVAPTKGKPIKTKTLKDFLAVQRWCSVLLFGDQTTGKAQPLDSKVLTANKGWVDMGSLAVGDEVRTPDNGTAKVLGIYPQGQKPVYKVALADGRVAESCDEHLWEVHNHNWKRRDGNAGYKVVPLSYLRERQKSRVFQTQGFHIDFPEPISYGDLERSLPLNPYAMGALLGDGAFSSASVVFTDNDESVVKTLETALKSNGMGLSTYVNYSIGHGVVNGAAAGRSPSKIKSILSDLGLIGLKSIQKFIPSVYKYASIEDRWSLLQGLMDTDGTVDRRSNSVSFSTSSKRMAEDFQEVARSLGCGASLTSRIPKYTHNGEKRKGARAYRVWVWTEDVTKLFSSERQLAKLKAIKADRSCVNKTRQRIVSIKYSRTVETQCILLDSPRHLYLTNNFIVTHNTRAASELLEMGYKVLYILADFGKSGTNTITNEFVRRPDLLKYADNMRILEPPDREEGQELNQAKEWVSTLYNFLRQPESVVPDIYDFDPDFIFLDGYSSYQMCDLEASLIPASQEFSRTDSEDWSTWRSDRNGTLFPLMRLIELHNIRTGKQWNKVVTALENEKGRYRETGERTKKGDPKRDLIAGSERIGPLLNTSARQLASAGFDVALRTVKKDFGGKPSYSYENGADLLSKDRNFGLPSVINDASFTKLWREYLEPMLRPIEAK